MDANGNGMVTKEEMVNGFNTFNEKTGLNLTEDDAS